MHSREIVAEKLKGVWPWWRIDAEIGSGSYGTVYKAVREDLGTASYSAIKMISIPVHESEVRSLKSDGLNDEAIRKYFERMVSGTTGEIKALESMKGASNIVSIEDYRVVENEDEIGWDIFIRMELLTSLPEYLADKTPDEAMALKLGIDICTALEHCEKKRIIHRDIKPENIFVSQFGDFKIGDFGIARELEGGVQSLSITGTQNYMAPEVRNMRYDETADIYSLGLVLFKLLNNNRLPFIDPEAQLISPQEYHEALDRRFSGQELPDPIGASPDLAQAIRKACAFDPADRYQSAMLFKKTLTSMVSENTIIRIAPARQAMQQHSPRTTQAISQKPSSVMPGETVSAGHVKSRSTVGPGIVKKQTTDDRFEQRRINADKKTKKTNRILLLALIAVLAVIFIAAVKIFYNTSGENIGAGNSNMPAWMKEAADAGAD